MSVPVCNISLDVSHFVNSSYIQTHCINDSLITDKSFSKITRTIKIASYQWRQDQKSISRIKKAHEFLTKDFHTAYWDDCVKESDHWKNNLLYLREKKLKQRLFQYTLNYVNDKHIIIKNTEYTILQGKYLGPVFSPWQLSYCFY